MWHTRNPQFRYVCVPAVERLQCSTARDIERRERCNVAIEFFEACAVGDVERGQRGVVGAIQILQLGETAHVEPRQVVAIAYQVFQIGEQFDTFQVGNVLVVDVECRQFGDIGRIQVSFGV